TLLLKGGTCLYKVDLGYRRMSEDVDLTIPGVATEYQSTNVIHINRVAQSLLEIGPVVGAQLVNFDGERFDRAAHAIWEVKYESAFLPGEKALISVYAVIRPAHRDVRKVGLRQLIPPELISGYGSAYCWALDYSEVRAEKVRAAFTREDPAIRDFYDLWVLATAEVDMGSPDFIELVDAKLNEIRARPLKEQPRSFGLTEQQYGLLGRKLTELETVLRFDHPKFTLQPVIDHYDRLWEK